MGSKRESEWEPRRAFVSDRQSSQYFSRADGSLPSCHFRRHWNTLYAKRRLVRAEWSLYTGCIATGSPMWHGFGLVLRLR